MLKEVSKTDKILLKHSAALIICHAAFWRTHPAYTEYQNYVPKLWL